MEPSEAVHNEVTSADGGSRVQFAFVAQWPAAAEFLRSLNMKPLIWRTIVSLCISLLSACSAPTKQPEVSVDDLLKRLSAGNTNRFTIFEISNTIPISAQSPRADVVKQANEYLARNSVNWGQPVKVEWLAPPPEHAGAVGYWIVTYPTPESELGWAGGRTVWVFDTVTHLGFRG